MSDSINSEFMRLLRKSGWTQTATADKLGITQGAVSQIVNEQVTASPVTLRLLRILVESDANPGSVLKDGVTSTLEDYETRLLADLRDLPLDQRAPMAEALRGVLHAALRPPLNYRAVRAGARPVSSKRPSEAARLLKRAAGVSDRK